MNAFRLFTATAALTLLAGCSTTTYRSIQEMESHNGNLVIKYGETVVKQELFFRQDHQHQPKSCPVRSGR